MQAASSAMKILLVDDHPVFRSGLALTARSLYRDAETVEAGDLSWLQSADDLGDAPPDLILLDLCLPGFDPLQDFPRLRRKLPLTPILVVSMVHDASLIDAVMRAGANGFVSKAAPPGELSSAILAVMDGETVVRRATGPEARADDPRNDDPVAALSPRQLEVLRLIARGLANKEIARELDISPFTVRVHVSAVLRTLGLANRSALASYASARGLE